MSGKRITMRKIRDILRLRHEGNLSIRQIRASTKVSVGAVQKLLARAETLQLGWPLDPARTDNQLARLFYPEADTRASRRFQVPDWAVVHQELKRKGMTKQLLWEEYSVSNAASDASVHSSSEASMASRSSTACRSASVTSGGTPTG